MKNKTNETRTPIEIEKNVPLPVRPSIETVNEKRISEKPLAGDVVPELADMKVGDSIYIPNTPGKAFPPVGAVMVWHYALVVGRRYVCEYDDDGMRVWRTK